MAVERRLHIETFRVYTDDVLSPPEIHRGAAVVSFWNAGMPARFLDFLMNPDKPDAASTYKGSLAYRLDEYDPPQETEGRVYEMGMDVNHFAGQFSTSVLFPNQVFSKKGRQTGRFAMALLKDNSPQSVKNGRAANIVRLNTAREVQTLATPHRGSSLLFMHEHRPVIIRDGGSQKGFPETKYALTYASKEGLSIDEYGARDEFDDWPGFDDGGGSDREPRPPIRPLQSGSVELPIPVTEDIDQADAVMPFREAGR